MENLNFVVNTEDSITSMLDSQLLSTIGTNRKLGNLLLQQTSDFYGDNLNLSLADNGELFQSMINAVHNYSLDDNLSHIDGNNDSSYKQGIRDPLSVILPITICYIFIFVAGVLGNVITCLVIAKNKTMHTATNYYLFNLAVSDFLVLVFGMPPDLYNVWYPTLYPFNEIVCVLQGLFSETSTNATVLTITSFTVERYIAICHPFRSHTMSKLSRVVRFIFAIWILAFLLAAPQALQFGIVDYNGGCSCTIKKPFFEYAFEISSFLFFFVPMTIICVLYVLIGIKLRKSKLLYGKKRKSCDSRCISGQTRVIRMLIAVVTMFFLCWAPFHAQRIMAIYGRIMHKSERNRIFMTVYAALTYISGILYFLSTCINPLLYNIMSNKFRNASKLTLFVHCYYSSKKANATPSHYSALSMKYGQGGGGSGRIVAVPRNHVVQIGNDSEVIEIKDFANAGSDNMFVSGSSRAKYNYNSYVIADSGISSCSRQTSTTTVSRNNSSSSFRFNSGSSFKKSSTKGQKNVSCLDNGTAGIHKIPEQSNSDRKSLASRFINCTRKVLTFKNRNQPDTEQTSPYDAKKDIVKKLGDQKPKNGSNSNSISNSSLREIDEEFNSAELEEFLSEIKKDRI